MKMYRVEVEGKEIFSFTDKYIRSATSFQREIDTQEFVYVDGDLLLNYNSPKLINYITKTKKVAKENKPVITMDIESITIKNIMIPYCICYYTGSKSFSDYLSYFNSSEEMLLKALGSLINKKHKDHVIYIHNLSKFDGVFILKVIAKINSYNSKINISVTKREYAIVNINIELKDKKDKGLGLVGVKFQN